MAEQGSVTCIHLFIYTTMYDTCCRECMRFSVHSPMGKLQTSRSQTDHIGYSFNLPDGPDDVICFMQKVIKIVYGVIADKIIP